MSVTVISAASLTKYFDICTCNVTKTLSRCGSSLRHKSDLHANAASNNTRSTKYKRERVVGLCASLFVCAALQRVTANLCKCQLPIIYKALQIPYICRNLFA